MPSTKMIQDHLQFIETNDPSVIVYQITGNANGDKWNTILVILNGSAANKPVTIPAGSWTLVGDGSEINQAGIKKINTTLIDVAGTAAYVLYK